MREGGNGDVLPIGEVDAAIDTVEDSARAFELIVAVVFGDDDVLGGSELGHIWDWLGGCGGHEAAGGCAEHGDDDVEKTHFGWL